MIAFVNLPSKIFKLHRLKISQAYYSLPADDPSNDEGQPDSTPSTEKHQFPEKRKSMTIRVLMVCTSAACTFLVLLLIFLAIRSATGRAEEHQSAKNHDQNDAAAAVTDAGDTLSSHASSSTAFPNIHSPLLRAELLRPQPWNYTHPLPSPCGHTPGSARAAGCKWSAMTFGWYPAPCFDTELEDDFLRLRNWTWHADESLSTSSALAPEDVLRGDVRRAWVSAEFHRLHCVYSMRKLLRAVLGVRLSDNYVVRTGHLLHCEDFLERVQREGVTAAKGVAKYFDCVAA